MRGIARRVIGMGDADGGHAESERNEQAHFHEGIPLGGWGDVSLKCGAKDAELSGQPVCVETNNLSYNFV